ncbi:2-keto-4-pentenoate hydratase [Asticcacaulis sp. 201]|uniref:2-keto-4-pentenoate hydratase n=1 Tax=Asticcacaulis sp. 201 TaxID=3028787 RepID=UPI002915E12A|nr:2-keto-4-pentenoate hydratase [Asticcacaulis sp. 201]MDV6331711.1 2-keto-4-pentenoate hydratase [Asticcacaulis sp. 201]
MTHADIAHRFVTARKTAAALVEYPGDIPEAMADSYRIQDAALDAWHQPLVGWKIARIHPDFQARHGERMAGPIFANTLKDYNGEELVYPVFTGGFAAVEAEFVLRIDHDADPEKTEYSEEEALRLCDALFAGVEVAGSPFPKINELGPTVTASDFGNNFGEILGPKLLEIDSDTTLDTVSPDALKNFKSKTEIDGQIVGEGGLFVMPGGPFQALAWLAGHLAQRGRPLKRGQLVSTGQTTGVHSIAAGQTSVITFSGIKDAQIRLRVEPLTARHTEIA